MFTEIKTIRNVLIPRVRGENLYFIRDDKLIRSNLNFKEEILCEVPTDLVSKGVFYDEFLIIKKKNLFILLNTNTNDVVKKDFDSVTFYGVMKNKLLFRKDEEDARYLYVFDFRKWATDFKFEIEVGMVHGHNNVLVHEPLYEKSLLNFYSFKDGSLLKKLDLNEIKGVPYSSPRFKGFTNIFYENTVIKSLPDWLLISFDLQSGEVSWVLNNVSHFISFHNNKLFNLDLVNFQIIDPKNGGIESKVDISEHFKKHNIEMGSSNSVCITNTHLIFTDTWKCQVGALNIETAQLDWVYQVDVPRRGAPEGGTLPFSPQIEGDRLYILDSEKNLHIFERE